MGLGAGALACGSGAPEPPAQLLDSRVRQPAVTVDGQRSDWEGNLTRVGDRDVFAGFHRQGDVLYMALVSQDRGFDARVFRAGLTVWFDTAAARRKAYGIRFPVFDAGARKRLRADSAAGGPDRERLLEAAGQDFIVVRNGTDETRVAADEAGGVELAAAVDRGLFTWELRLPLGTGADAPHALPLSGADTISVGLQAGGDQGELARAAGAAALADSARAARPPDSVEADGRPGRRGRPGARGGRPGGPGSGQVPPLEVWVRVNLSQEASP